MPLSTNLADRVRGFLAHPGEWARFPDDVREWLEVQAYRSVLPEPGQLLVETFPREGRHYMVAYSFEGWNAHQSLGMLITRRMETQGLKPLGFVANDYAHRDLRRWSRSPIPQRCSRPTSWSTSSSTGCSNRTCSSARSARSR